MMTVDPDTGAMGIDTSIRVRIRVSPSQPAYGLLQGKSAAQIRALALLALNQLGLQQAARPAQADGRAFTGPADPLPEPDRIPRKTGTSSDATAAVSSAPSAGPASRAGIPPASFFADRSLWAKKKG